MRTRPLAIASCLVATLILLTACATPASIDRCTDPLGCLEILPGSPILVGTVFATSGDEASLGVDSLRAVKLAEHDLGEIDGHALAIDNQDSDCRAVNARLAAQRLALDPDLVAVIGPTCSAEAAAAVPILDRAGLTVISPGAAGPSGAQGYFRLVYPASVPDLTAGFLLDVLGARRIVLGDDGTAETMERVDQLEAALRSTAGPQVSLQRLSFSAAGLPGVVAQLAGTPPEALYLSVPPFLAGQVLLRLRASPALALLPVVGDQILFSPETVRSGQLASSGLLLIGPDVSALGQPYSDFLTRYRSTYGQAPDSGEHPFAYAAMQLLAHAILASGRIRADGSLLVPRGGLRQALAATQELPTLIGRVSCGSGQVCSSAGFNAAIYRLVQKQEGGWDLGLGPERLYP